MKPPKLHPRDLETLAKCFTASIRKDPKQPYLERVFDVIFRFLEGMGYEIITPDLRVAEARVIDSKLQKEYFKALKDTVLLPVGVSLEDMGILLVMASPEDRVKALTKVYSRGLK